MQSEVDIIPVEQLDRQVTALVKARADMVPELPGYSLEQVRHAYHDFYLQAIEARWPIMVVRLLTHKSPNLDEQGRRVWKKQMPNGAILTSTYDAHSGVMIVKVGETTVLSNERPGNEILIPGQWLFTARDDYVTALNEKRWKAEIETEKERVRLSVTVCYQRRSNC